MTDKKIIELYWERSEAAIEETDLERKIYLLYFSHYCLLKQQLRSLSNLLFQKVLCNILFKLRNIFRELHYH